MIPADDLATAPRERPAAPEPVLRVEGLEVGYAVGGEVVPAVRGVSFEVRPHEIVAIVGASGSGKTTTLHALAGLSSPNAVLRAGSVALGDRSILGLGERALRSIRGREVGYVPQDPTVALDPVKSIGSQLIEAIRVHRRIPAATARALAGEALRDVGIDDPDARLRQYPHELSGGQKQRVLIAIAVAHDPGLVLADEPTSGLDVTVQRLIMDQLQRRTREHGTAVLLITHDLALAAERADRILVMHDGEIVEHGDAATVFVAPRHDYTRRLLAAAPAAHAAPVRARAARRPTGGEVVLRAEGLTKHYTRAGGERTTAVSDVSFVLQAGESLGIVGESGSGKTTIARIVAGLEVASAGTVEIAGARPTAAVVRRPLDVRRSIQYVHQNPFASLNPHWTVERIVREPLDYHSREPDRNKRRRVHEILERVGLGTEHRGVRPRLLSGGQRQRVAIARALVQRPALVIMDEPVSNLDVLVQDQILQLLNELRSSLGVSYLFISHDLAVVREVCDAVAVLHRGQIQEHGASDDIFANPRAPHTRALIAAIPRPAAPQPSPSA